MKQQQIKEMIPLLVKSGMVPEEIEEVKHLSAESIDDLHLLYWRPAHKVYISPCQTEPERADAIWEHMEALEVVNPTTRKLTQTLNTLKRAVLCQLRDQRKQKSKK